MAGHLDQAVVHKYIHVATEDLPRLDVDDDTSVVSRVKILLDARKYVLCAMANGENLTAVHQSIL